MMKLATLTVLAGSAAAFAPVSQNGQSATALSAAKSKALPFLPAPEGLDGYAGAVGFDPLGVSKYFPSDYLVESELKHGRIAQMAWLGYVAVDNGIRLDFKGQMDGLTSATAHDKAVEIGSLGNLLVWIAFMEMAGWIGISQMLQGSGRVPGDYGLGKGFLNGKSEEQIAQMKLKEVTHCRLAMLAISGVLTQSVLFEKGFPYF